MNLQFANICQTWLKLLQTQWNNNQIALFIKQNNITGYSYPQQHSYQHADNLPSELLNIINVQTDVNTAGNNYVVQILVGCKQEYKFTSLSLFYKKLNLFDKQFGTTFLTIIPYYSLGASRTTVPCIIRIPEFTINIAINNGITNTTINGLNLKQEQALWQKFYKQAQLNINNEILSDNIPPLFTPTDKKNIASKIGKIQKLMNKGECYLINFSLRKNLSANNYKQYSPTDFFTMWLSRQSRFGVYYSNKKTTLLSFSPERFLAIHNNIIVAEPIKGTYQNPVNTSPTLADATALWQCDKEIMEQTLVADLLRNDLNKVCLPSSVQIFEPFFAVVSGKLLQMQSFIFGTLRDLQINTILQNMLPAGSITGTPKKRVCELITHFEDTPRDYYTGICGLKNAAGNFDSTILIRSLFAQGKKTSVGLGVGITTQSNINSEINELSQKFMSFISNSSAKHASLNTPLTPAPISPRILFIDHFDSFSDNILANLRALNMEVTVINTDTLTTMLNNVDKMWITYQGIILSPGPKHPRDYPQVQQLINACLGKIPLVGICLGMQAVLMHEKAKIEKITTTPKHGRRCLVKANCYSQVLSNFNYAGQYVLYNSLGCLASAKVFRDTEWKCLSTENNFALIAENVAKRALLVQFHPESFASKENNNQQSFFQALKDFFSNTK